MAVGSNPTRGALKLFSKMKDKRKYSDRREENIKAVAKRRRKIKSLSVEYKGGECQVCGYHKFPGALELHHIDPKTKEFGIGSKGYTRSWEKVKAELEPISKMPPARVARDFPVPARRG